VKASRCPFPPFSVTCVPVKSKIYGFLKRVKYTIFYSNPHYTIRTHIKHTYLGSKNRGKEENRSFFAISKAKLERNQSQKDKIKRMSNFFNESELTELFWPSYKEKVWKIQKWTLPSWTLRSRLDDRIPFHLRCQRCGNSFSLKIRKIWRRISTV